MKKSFLGFNKSLWGPLELVEKLCPEAAEISASVRDLPGLKYGGPFKFTHVLTCNISLHNAGGTRSNIRTAHTKPELQKGNPQPDFSLVIISVSFLFLSADVRTYTGTFLKQSNARS